MDVSSILIWYSRSIEEYIISYLRSLVLNLCSSAKYNCSQGA